MSPSGKRVAPAVEQAAATAASLAELREQHRPVQHTVAIPMRADLRDEIRVLERQAAREAQVDKWENRAPVAPRLAQRIRELEGELAASEAQFTFVSIGRRPYARLLGEHPPTGEQQAEAEKAGVAGLAYNSETFPPALLAASCVSPGGTVEDWADVWDTWSDGQLTELWSACLAANKGVADVGPKSLIASEILDGSETSSTTARR